MKYRCMRNYLSEQSKPDNGDGPQGIREIFSFNSRSLSATRIPQ